MFQMPSLILKFIDQLYARAQLLQNRQNMIGRPQLLK